MRQTDSKVFHTMQNEPKEAKIIIQGSANDDLLMSMTRSLQNDLAKAGIPLDDVEENHPTGTRGGGIELGQIALTLISSGTLVALIEVLKAYLSRGRDFRFKVKNSDGTEVELQAGNISLRELKDLFGFKD